MNYDVYVPSNILTFKCNMCGDCCKKKWTIFVTKNEYEYLKRLYTDRGLVNLFNIAFAIENINSIERYAKLVNDCGKCVLLNDDNLCSKQLEFGIDALSKTCFDYPKNIMFTPRGMEVYMYYSCDTALKTLEIELPIKIIKNPQNFTIKYSEFKKVELEENLKEFYFLLEDFLLLVLQNRNLTIEQRLLVLTYITANTQNLNLTKENLPLLLKVVENAENIINNVELMHELENIKSNIQYQVGFISNTLNNNYDSFMLIKEDISYINEVFGLKEIKFKINEISEKYLMSYKKIYIDLEKDVQIIIENYLCQIIFRKEFAKTFIHGLYLLTLYYSLLRFFAIYLCIKKDKKLDKEILFDAIKLVENGFAHNIHFAEAIDENVKKGEIDIPSIIALFKM